MDSFRFTLFNSLALFLMAATVGMVVARAKAPRKAFWPAAYWLLPAAFAWFFKYGLNPWLVAVGIAMAALVPFTRHTRAARLAELLVLAYVFTRCLELLLLW